MACVMSINDIEWMREKHPGLFYFEKHNGLAGKFSFRAQLADMELIDDHYIIAIYCGSLIDSPIPAVYEIDGRIKRISQILGVDTADLHMNDDGSLCIIRPDKFKIWYPYGFDIKTFEHNLVTHFYWLSYRERYGKEPWKGEEHGGHFSY